MLRVTRGEREAKEASRKHEEYEFFKRSNVNLVNTSLLKRMADTMNSERERESLDRQLNQAKIKAHASRDSR